MHSPPLTPLYKGGEWFEKTKIPSRLVIDGRRLTAQRTGVGRYLETLLNGWARTGWPAEQVVLAVQDDSVVDRIPSHPALKVKVIGPKWPGLVWEVFGLKSLLKPHDILFAPTNLSPPNWRGRTVLVMFDTLLETCPEGFSRLTRLRFKNRYKSAAQRATRVIVPSVATRDDVIRFYDVDAARIEVIYPAVEPHFQRVGPDAISHTRLTDQPYFLFVGKPSQRRHVPEILAAFEEFRQESPETQLIFVGPGSESIPDRPGVIRAGHVAENVLVGLLNGAIACLYPSDYEGFGLPVAEAMACGCPVVTLRKNALIESGGDAAFYLDEPSVSELKRALLTLANHSEVRANHVQFGLEQARKFQGDGFADAVKAVISRQVGLATTPPGGVV